MNWAELGITTVDTLVVRANVAFLHVSYRLKFRINLKGSLTTCMYDNPWVHRNREQPIPVESCGRMLKTKRGMYKNLRFLYNWLAQIIHPDSTHQV